MQRTLVSLFRVLPLWMSYGVMSLAIPFYVLFDHRGRKASYRFFRQRMGYGRLSSSCAVFSNMYNMGKVVIDRFSAYSGKRFEVLSPDQEKYNALTAAPGAFMLLSAHVGNFEMLGYMLKAARPTKVLVYDGETATVMQNRARMFSQTQVEMVPLKEDLSHVYTLNSTLANGEIAALPADRPLGSRKTVRLPFLGADASFPAGPFSLAAGRQVPVLATFMVKENRSTYRLIMERLPYPKDASAPQAAEALAKAYVHALETVTRQYPKQWFNFYDFWAE